MRNLAMYLQCLYILDNVKHSLFSFFLRSQKMPPYNPPLTANNSRGKTNNSKELINVSEERCKYTPSRERLLVTNDTTDPNNSANDVDSFPNDKKDAT